MVTQISFHKYIGLSSDNKPTGAAVGAEFFEYDTGRCYVCPDGQNWYFKNCEMNFMQQVGMGLIPSAERWYKIGYTGTMNDTLSDVWSKAGVYTFPTAETQMEVVSSNNVDDIGTILYTGTDDGGSTTTLVKDEQDFSNAAVGDCVILDKATNPEYGFITAINDDTITVAGGFSKGGSAYGRTFHILDYSAHDGAQAVVILYLDDAFARKEEIVILNGTTAVDLINDDTYRINGFRVIFAGANGEPTGNLTLQGDGGGTTYSYIRATYTRAKNIVYTVPAGYTLYITRLNWAYSIPANPTNTCHLYLKATQYEGFKSTLFYSYFESTIVNASETIDFEIPKVINSGVDIKISGIATNTGTAMCRLEGFLMAD